MSAPVNSLTRTRRGASTLGCLVWLLVICAVGYFAINYGEAYWRFYQYRDAMRQQVDFAGRRDDDAIREALRAVADSLELPESAREPSIRRHGDTITIEATYYERVELPLHVREIQFHPNASGTF